jgi:two-component system NarL family response regulator
MSAFFALPFTREPDPSPATIAAIVIAARELMGDGIALTLRSIPHVILPARYRRWQDADPDIAVQLVVLDTTAMGRAEAVDAVVGIRRLAHKGARLLAIVEEQREALAVDLLRTGVDGIVSSDVPTASIAAAAQYVIAGETAMSARLQHVLLRAARTPRPILSAREQLILRYAAEGYGNKEIAARLQLGEGAVKSDLRRLMQRLGARDRTHAVAIALRHEIVVLD